MKIKTTQKKELFISSHRYEHFPSYNWDASGPGRAREMSSVPHIEALWGQAKLEQWRRVQ